MRSAEALAAAALTLGLAVTRPRGLNEGVAALLGALLVFLLQLVPIGEALRLEASAWNTFLFFLGMLAIAALADQSGVFDQLAHLAARLARGRIVVLYLAVFLVGSLIALLFADDSAALVLTPIVYALLVRLALDPLSFIFATTFIADTASVGLPVSNPLNVILADRFDLDLATYVSHLSLSAVIVVVIDAVLFRLFFRRRLRGSFHLLPEPAPQRVAGSILLLFGLLAAAYLAASALLVPLGIVAVAGTAALALNLWRLGRLDGARLRREISWPIFGFLVGMQIVVQGLADTGITAAFGRPLAAAGSPSHLATIAVTVGGAALGANVINNLPTALVMTATIPPL